MRRVLSALSGVLVLTTGMGQVAVCGTPGFDGPVNVAQTINTYFPASGTITLATGSTSAALAAVPAADAFGNNFGTIPIAAGDLLLIYQVQDADIDITNSNLYGSSNATAGPDGLGGTGYTALNNTGRYEFLVATNAVPLTGGTLTFRGGGSGSGTVYAYANRDGTSTLTQKRFQVVRVPQFSNLTLTSNLTCPPWNGRGGGIIAFDVAGQFDFNGYSISANGRGFRAGYQDIAGSGSNLRDLYVTATYDQASGKGENIAGTPRYMWDGFN
ncbi:MAG: hypothetical protein KA791_12190, partial [Flavobacteriales bacterium]|nr:hypothetical protein [Flavobacteriales bacterium]